MSQSCGPRGSSKTQFYLIVASKDHSVGFKGHMRLEGGKKKNLYCAGTEHKFMVKNKGTVLVKKIDFFFLFSLLHI